MKHLLVIDHNAVQASSRALYNAFHQTGLAHTTIVSPDRWREFGVTRTGEQVRQGPEVVPLKAVFRGRHHRVMYRGLADVLRRVDPDIVLCNAEPENFLAWQVVVERKRLGARFAVVLISWRNIDYRTVGYPYKVGLIHRHIERKVLSSIDAIVAHSSDAVPMYQRWGFRRVTAIPPAVDCSLFAPEPRIEKATRGSVRVGFVGRFTLLKGGDILLRAVRGTPPEVELTMIGSGEEEARWKRLSRELGITSRVHWHGPVPYCEMPSVLMTLDVLVLPSRTGKYWKEQFGRVLVEAMACGVVVVGSSSGEIPRVIGEAGEIVEEGDDEKLTESLCALARDSDRREHLVELGLRRVKLTYCLEAVLPLYGRLFEQLAGSKS